MPMGGLHQARYALTHASPHSDVEDELAHGSQLSIVRLLDLLLDEASECKASDIHIDPGEETIALRMRIDGILHAMHVIPMRHLAELVARIKVLASLRIDEHMRAQDGRFACMHEGNAFDVRVSITPTHFGERAVLRLLSKSSQIGSLQELGFTARHVRILERTTRKTSGLILATGPTGSGKTTTLYALLSLLNTPAVSIVTIEDPVEYAIAGINHMQAAARHNLTFAEGLRSVLRQDPDIIMVGEIRDRETAHVAINAALTGHLVLSTLHTTDAPRAVMRLVDMGIEPYLIASTLSLVVGQRLVRRVCEFCVESCSVLPALLDTLPPEALNELMHPEASPRRASGCENCAGVGYHGRIGMHELLEISDTLRESIAARVSLERLQQSAKEGGMISLLQDGARKAARGITTIEEVMRVYGE